MRSAAMLPLLVLSTSLAFAAAAGAVTPAPPPDFPAVVARVDGLEISRAELVTQAGLRRAEAMAAGADDPAGQPAFYREILDTLVAEKLLFLDAAKRGATAPAAEIEAAIAAMRRGFPDEAALAAALAKQGTSLADVRRQLEQSLTLERVIRDEIAPTVKVDAAAKRAFYEQVKDRYTAKARYRARHILFLLPAAATAEDRAAARRKATGYVGQLRAGADFAQLARQVSEDPQTRDAGGDLGWIVPTGGVAATFDEVLERLKPGQVSDVVETGAGLHILQLVEHRPPGPRPYEELEPKIDAHLRQRELARAVAARVKSLRGAAKVDVLI